MIRRQPHSGGDVVGSAERANRCDAGLGPTSVFLYVSLVLSLVFLQTSVFMFVGIRVAVDGELPFGASPELAWLVGTSFVVAWFVLGPLSIVAAFVFAVIGTFRSTGRRLLGAAVTLLAVVLAISAPVILFNT